MSEVRSVEVRYASVLVGRSTTVRDWDTAGAFIGFAEPLPSGTSLVLRGEGIDQPARVVEVFESADPAVAGMRVEFIGAAEAPRPVPRPTAAAVNPAPGPEPARAPEPTAVTAASATVVQVPVAHAEASLVEASEAPSTAAPAEKRDGETGQLEQAAQGGSGGKRRRRRR